jgi:anti-repressor protein
MNTLIKIQEQDNKQVVSARELHEFLGSKKDFSSWIKTRIDRYGFKENEDFVMLTQSGEQNKSSRGGHNKIDYVLTVDCAKELSMVEGTEKGRQARAYFIDCEKKLKVKQEKIEGAFSAEMMLEQFKLLLGQGIKLDSLERKQDAIEKKLEQLQSEDGVKLPVGYVSVMGFARIKKIFLDNTAASLLSKVARKECDRLKRIRYKISDSRWGFVWAYPEEVLELVFNTYYEMLLMLR